MRTTRAGLVLPVACLVLFIGTAAGKTRSNAQPDTGYARAQPDTSYAAKPDTSYDPTETDTSTWSFYASVTVYRDPDETDFAQPLFVADRGYLHIEARYNYEYLETGSLSVGVNTNGGKSAAWTLTPMVGMFFGSQAGIVPACTISLRLWIVELWSENRYVYNLLDGWERYFYDWSELALWPGDEFRLGTVAQYVHSEEDGGDARYGILSGVAFEHVEATLYIFDLNVSNPPVVFELGYNF